MDADAPAAPPHTRQPSTLDHRVDGLAVQAEDLGKLVDREELGLREGVVLTRLAASSRDRFKIRYGAKPNFYWISDEGIETRIFTITNNGKMRLFSESLIKQGMEKLAEQIRATATIKVPGIHEGGDFHQLSVDITSESVGALCSVAQYVCEVLSEERGKA